MLKYILLVICLLGCSQQRIQVNHQLQAGSIDDVASQFINDLYQDKQVRVFRLDLPPQAVLPDHLTGPRVIVLLTDLSGQRISDDSRIEAKANQAFYLTNTFSAGFQNSSTHSASYLVISLVQQPSAERDQTCQKPAFAVLLEKAPVVVCQSLEAQTYNFPGNQKTLHYNQTQSQVLPISDQAQPTLEVGDLMIFMAE